MVSEHSIATSLTICVVHIIRGELGGIISGSLVDIGFSLHVFVWFGPYAQHQFILLPAEGVLSSDAVRKAVT